MDLCAVQRRGSTPLSGANLSEADLSWAEHARTSFTMDVYAHLLPGRDEEASVRIDAALRKAMDSATRQ